MKNRIRVIGGLATSLIAAAVVAFFALQPDRYPTRERRAAKEQMIEEIEMQVARLDPETELEGSRWWDETFIRFRDGSWIAYRAQCHKVDPKVYDLFIGRASDGSWYDSTYHLCIGMLALRDHPRMDMFRAFISEYALEGFDGASDQALSPTWPEPVPTTRGGRIFTASSPPSVFERFQSTASGWRGAVAFQRQ